MKIAAQKRHLEHTLHGISLEVQGLTERRQALQARCCVLSILMCVSEEIAAHCKRFADRSCDSCWHWVQQLAMRRDGEFGDLAAEVAAAALPILERMEHLRPGSCLLGLERWGCFTVSWFILGQALLFFCALHACVPAFKTCDVHVCMHVCASLYVHAWTHCARVWPCMHQRTRACCCMRKATHLQSTPYNCSCPLLFTR